MEWAYYRIFVKLVECQLGSINDCHMTCIDRGNISVNCLYDYSQLRKRMARAIRHSFNQEETKNEDKIILFDNNGNVISQHKVITNEDIEKSPIEFV